MKRDVLDLSPPSGRSAGGQARALALSPERRSEIARQGARARWGGGPWQPRLPLPKPPKLKRGDRVHVVAGDYAYFGRIAAVFRKLKSGQTRFVVEDACGRLFIHGAAQLHACKEDRDMARIRIEITNEDTGEDIRSLILEHPEMDDDHVAQAAADALDELVGPFKLRERP